MTAPRPEGRTQGAVPGPALVIGGRGLALYALASAGLIAVAGAVYALVYATPAARQAVLVSAVVAFVVQLATFTLARLFAASGNAIAGWGIGAMVCLVTLVIYGFVCRAIGAPTDAALLSMATFLFLTEVIEPLFLSR